MSEKPQGILCTAIAKGYYGGLLVQVGQKLYYDGALKPDSEGNLTVLPLWLIRDGLPPEQAEQEKKEKLAKSEATSHLDYNNPPPLETLGKTLPLGGGQAPAQQPPAQQPPVQETPKQEPPREGMTGDLPDQVQQELTGTVAKPENKEDVQANIEKMF